MNTGMQYSDDEDDLFDSSEEDEEEAETELSALPSPQSAVQQISKNMKSARRLRVRPMSPTMAKKHPEVVSIMLTRSDGRQLMFVRK